MGLGKFCCCIKRLDKFCLIWFPAGISAVLLIAAIVGAGFYGNEQIKTKTYKGSSCLVTNATVDTTTCTEDQCTGTSSNKQCETVSYTCYAVFWKVKYDVDNEKVESKIAGSVYRDQVDAMNQEKNYKLGTTYDCYYDSLEIKVVQWSFPNPNNYFTWMVVCFALTGGLWVYIAIAVAVRKLLRKMKGTNARKYRRENI